MVTRGLTVGLLACAILSEWCSAYCRFDGCDGYRSFSLDTDDGLATGRTRTWQLRKPWVVPYPEGHCVVNSGGVLVCTSSRGGPGWDNRSVPGLVAFDPEGHPLWNSTDIFNTSALPIADLNGNVFASDGFNLVALASTGQPLGPPALISPNMGNLHSLAATHNNVFVLPSTDRDVATYLTNGVPLGSMWLNATVDGCHGTYTATQSALVSGFRAVFPTQFRPDNASCTVAQADCRLFAIDIYRRLVGKMIQAWNVSIPCGSPSSFTHALPSADGFPQVDAPALHDARAVFVSLATMLPDHHLSCVAAVNEQNPVLSARVQCFHDDGVNVSRTYDLAVPDQSVQALSHLALGPFHHNASTNHTGDPNSLLLISFASLTWRAINFSRTSGQPLDIMTFGLVAEQEFVYVPGCPLMMLAGNQTGCRDAFLVARAVAGSQLFLLQVQFARASSQVTVVHSVALPLNATFCSGQMVLFAETQIAVPMDTGIVFIDTQ
ncbi:uncharacterized protein MONBRDRAFT_28653 [Monosiga brevicollis MX1]|uniref:Uncharacterized protein n=1 Tax=Monosiga brevicollis TaxID=81824 RepID=A9V8S9_MONBE|nr:uncharacterized protein MONBRDRAFT_28653 [Monosiga brevicollis MX1]EDQ86014.1 predicted protein [Monosiga brevicollis MX1]|eukprot:XP_001749208.1 hypothetical protein [Monosiga brevicollis MX1]